MNAREKETAKPAKLGISHSASIGMPASVVIGVSNLADDDELINLHIISNHMEATSLGGIQDPVPNDVSATAVCWLDKSVPAKTTQRFTAQFIAPRGPTTPESARITAIVCTAARVSQSALCRNHSFIIHYK